MPVAASQEGALEWVLAKLSAKRTLALQAPVYKPPEFKPPQPAAPKSFAEKEKQLLATRSKEMTLLLEWKKTRDPETFDKLRKSAARLFAKKLNEFKGAEVNKKAQEAYLINQFYNAANTWDPAKGANFATHVFNNFRGLKRFVVQHQNPLRIGEQTAAKITPYRQAVQELTEKLGYEPTDQQIVEHTLKWGKHKLSLKDIREQRQQVIPNYDISAGGELVEGAGAHGTDPVIQAAHITRPSLKPHEQKVSELMFPPPGRAPLVKSGEIARKLKWEVSKVSKAKNAILKKIQEHMGE